MTSQNPTPDDTVTPQNGHCDHCWDYCPHVPNTENKWHQATDPFIGPFDAVWAESECPMCAAVTAERAAVVAELKHIAELFVNLSRPLSERESGMVDAYNHAADLIQHGAHLEGQ